MAHQHTREVEGGTGGRGGTARLTLTLALALGRT